MAFPATTTALILAAGFGSRLGASAGGKPKALASLDGETILQRALRLLAGYGVSRVVCATGYRSDAVRAALRGVELDVVLVHNPEYEKTQNAVSFALCRDAIRDDEAFFKLDGDLVFQAPVLERLDRSEGELALAVDRERPLDAEAMKVEIGPDDGVLALGKHLSPRTASAESIGLERLAPPAVPRVFRALADAAADGRTSLYYEDVYAELLARGEVRAQAISVGDLWWAEVDTPEDLETARAMTRAERDRTG